MPDTERWSLLIDRARPGWHNMAIDAALLDRADTNRDAFFRLYRWEPYCLSFGRHEPALRRYDREQIRAQGLDCVRRPTGGRAVWHARELTYAVAAPLSMFGGLQAAYAAIHGLFAAALSRLGVSPILAAAGAPVPGVHAGPCFAAPVGGEVLIDGLKIVGSAQLRQNDAFLQHGSLLLQDDQSLPRALAGMTGGEPGEAPLSRLAGREIAFDEAALAVSDRARERWPGLECLASLPPSIVAGAARHAGRFQSPEWTWQR